MRSLILLTLSCLLAGALAAPSIGLQESRPTRRSAAKFDTITREGAGGVTLTADRYAAAKRGTLFRKTKPILVCLHMARSSRGEYREIAPQFAELGLEVLAVDMRSGAKRFDVDNETANSAFAKLKKKQDFDDAFSDIATAVEWAHELAPKSPVFLMGSSYTSSLSLKFASENPDKVDAVLAFSPGNYRPNWKIDEAVRSLEVPAFVTWGSGEREKNTAKDIVAAVPTKVLTSYDPDDSDRAEHGSRMLATESRNARKKHWKAVQAFFEPLDKR